MKIEKIKAKSISYGARRSLSSIGCIVIHYTGNDGDTAQANGRYFRDSNTRTAGAHFFVSQNGDVVESIPMELTAWAVGGDHRSGRAGEAKYYGIYTNNNTVSIELCDNASRGPSAKQTEAVKELISYICDHCQHIKTIARHWDINGKPCPGPYLLVDTQWKAFVKKVAPLLSYTTGGTSGTKANKTIQRGQSNANRFLHDHLPGAPTISEDGIRGSKTAKQCTRVLQEALNLDFKAGLVADGIIGPKTRTAINGKVIKKGDKRYLCLAAKILYQCAGKDANLKYSRTFGGGLEKVSGKSKITEKDLLELL